MYAPLTPWSRDIPETLTDPQLVRKFLALCEIRLFYTAFTRARHSEAFVAVS